MKKIATSIILAIGLSCFVSLVSAQENGADCKQIVTNSCTKCHAITKTCKELDEENADWPKIVEKMGNMGGLSADEKEAVLNCVTAPDAKKTICE